MDVWVHVWQGEVRWGDMDAYGHVNHTVFFRYLESARVACLAAVRAARISVGWWA